MAEQWTVAAIRAFLDRQQPEEAQLAFWRADPRKGVQQALLTWERRRQRQQEEEARLQALWRYERRWHEQGALRVCGVDEAGRGPLAGPVAVAAVILPGSCLLPGLNDSKKLSPLQRERLYADIRRQAQAISLVWVTPEEIDRYNIYQATVRGMQQAVRQLQPQPQAALVDAVELKGIGMPCEALVHGDALSASIAAASIIAKVERDRLMVQLEAQYPGYGFAAHKGYGTAEHVAALQRLGPSPIHRRTFEPVRSLLAGRNGL